MKIILAIAFASAFWFAGMGSAEFPETTISNGIITAKVLLPDAEKGYYRGARFDWGGVISSLDYKGHSYFGQWFDRYDPLLHDAIMGPVDEFREPIGYEAAKAGETFIKIGVGELKKPDDNPYQFSKKYEILNRGKWQVKSGKDQVKFVQELQSKTGIAFRYEKTVSLVAGKPELLIEHKLTNTGKNTIRTSTYNHNFFMIDGEPTGPNLKTGFPFEISAKGNGFGDIARTEGRQLSYNRPLKKGENVFSDDLRSDKSTKPNYGFTIENTKSGAGVRVSCDQAVDRMVYWACATTACPEPYIDLELPAGKSSNWNITYTFFENR